MSGKWYSFLALAVFAAPSPAPCASAEAVFAGDAIPDGWSAADGSLVSPVYAFPVERVSLQYSQAGDGAAEASLYASSANGETFIASLNTESLSAAFSFPASSCFTRFRIAAGGTFSLDRFSAEWTALIAPANARVADWTSSTVTLAWDEAEGAQWYEVVAWTNGVSGADAGTAVWSETFAAAPESASTAAVGASAAAALFDNEGWEFPDNVYYAPEPGAVRIGTTSKSGRLVSPSLPESGSVHLRVTARRMSATAAAEAVLQIARGAGRIAVDGEERTFHILLDSVEEGDRIIVNSIDAGDRRLVVQDVALVSGYAEGTAAEIVVAREIVPASSLSGTIEGLPECEVFAGVRSIGAAQGVVSEMSAALTVDCAHAPSRTVGVAGLAGGVYSQDFSSLPDKSGDWADGITLPGWSAAYGADAAASITRATPKSANGGIYTCSTNEYASSPALGCLSTQTKAASFAVAFTNDTQSMVSLDSVAFSAQQWGFANTAPQTLVLEYSISGGEWNALAEQSTMDEAAGTYPAAAAVAARPEGVYLRQGETLTLRWTLEKPVSGHGALMAVDGLEVTFSAPPRFYMRIAEAP